MEGQPAIPAAINDQQNGSSMNYGELGKQALAQMEKTPLFTDEGKEETKVIETKVEPVNTPAVDAQKTEPTVDTSQKADESDTTQSDILKLPDTARIEVLVDGKPTVISVADYKAGIQREAVFTKRMQTLAEQRKQVEADLAQQAAELQSMAKAIQQQQQIAAQNNPLAQLQKLIEQQQQKPEQDPNSIATIGELKAMLQEAQKTQADALKSQETKFLQTLEQAQKELQERQADARDAMQYTTALQKELNSEDAKVIREQFLDPAEAESLIRFNVAKMNPQSIDEAIQFTNQYVKGWVQHIKSKTVAQNKQVEAAKAAAKLEPSNGSAPAIGQTSAAPKSFLTKDGKIDYKALSERANALLG